VARYTPQPVSVLGPAPTLSISFLLTQDIFEPNFSLISKTTIRKLSHKQLIRPMMDYACLAWSSAASSHVQKLQVLQSRCLRLATGAPWYVSSRQIHEDQVVPLFADHIRALTASFDSRLANVGNPLVRQLGRYYADRGLTRKPRAAGASRPVEAIARYGQVD